MTFTALPEAARQAALAEGTVAIHAMIDDYVANGGQPPTARLNAAQQATRDAAQATVEATWPDVLDEPGLSTQWALWLVHAIYAIGATAYDLDALAGVERQRAYDFVKAAMGHTPSQRAAAGVINALRHRGGPHPDDPCDPAFTAVA